MLLCKRQPERVDIAECSDLPVTLVFLPAHDIAMFVGEGNVDIGITGLDVVKETSDDSEIEVAMVSELEMLENIFLPLFLCGCCVGVLSIFGDANHRIIVGVCVIWDM